MMSGKLWKHSRSSACLLYHVQLPSTTLARPSSCILLVQRRWQSYDQSSLATERPESDAANNGPARQFGRGGQRSSVGPVRLGQLFSARADRSQNAAANPFDRGNNTPPGPGARLGRPEQPSYDRQRRPSPAAHIKPRSMPLGNNRIGGGPSASPREAPRQPRSSPNPAFGAEQGQSQNWGQLSSRRRHPPAAHPHRAAAPRQGSPMTRKPDEDFWSDLEARVGAQDKPGARQRGGRETQNSDWGWADSHKPQGRGDTYGDAARPPKRRQQQARQPGRQEQEQHQPVDKSWHAVPPADLAPIADYIPSEFSSPWEHERHRKARKERPADRERKLSKEKQLRRRNSAQHEAEEDDDFDDDYAERVEERRRRKEEKRRRKELELEAAQQGAVPILLPGFISVGNLGTALRIKPHIFLRQLAELGFEDITVESIMTGETAALIAQEYGYDPTVDSGQTVDLKARPAPEDPSTLPARPPIVTIMGHVDHGKTTMLDWLRKSSVAAQEHGGITQHIGAFSVKLSSGKQITFLDTPGHAAFLTMRQRGANVTDIVILVVAADDSVKPQTLEALKHARAAKVPIIVAINKVDKDEARPDQVKSDLARHGVEIEDYGGDVQVVCVSGRTGQGMDDLEENILTLSEILDVRAEPDGMAEGWVLESSVKPVGRAASVLVKRGTLRRGDIVVAGTTWARIRSMRNEAGAEVDEASPATPVEILGWKELPDAGDEVLQAPNEARAKEATEYREELEDRETAASEFEVQERKEREQAALAATAEAIAAEAAKDDDKIRESATGVTEAEEQTGGPIMVNLTIKGDVMGSVEAVCSAVQEIGNQEVQPRVLRSAPGPVTEFDVEHAAATGAVIVNFNTPVPPSIQRKAEDAGVSILDHTVIYHLIDDVKDKLSDRLAPLVSSRVLGEAEVLQLFPINTKGRQHKNIAGCRVRNGLMTRGALYRVFRGGEKVFDGKLESLRQGKKDATEMRKGTECGISFDEWQDMAVGDTVQAYEEITEKRKL